ncbi:MAG: 4Fe-4S binding protein [Candidatus Cloacimonetes bacterium]|nr:4Fe-4S binding protein [Candidatus Cloacimonadota bacterium]
MMSKFILRRIIQLIFLLLSIYIVMTAVNFISHRYCPYAVICFGLRGLNPEVGFFFITAIIGGLIILLSTLFIGRRFCGYVCPLGTVIEYLNYLNPFRKKVLRKRVPPNVEKSLRLGKYLILIGTALFAFFLWGYLYYQICPVMLATGSVNFTPWGIIITAVIIIGSIFVMRFWCRYLCPYGALMNCFQFIGKKFGIKRSMIYRNLEVCNDCRCCEYNCQMNIDITDAEYIEDLNCIFCLNCIKACPKDMCLTLDSNKNFQ